MPSASSLRSAAMPSSGKPPADDHRQCSAVKAKPPSPESEIWTTDAHNDYSNSEGCIDESRLAGGHCGGNRSKVVPWLTRAGFLLRCKPCNVSPTVYDESSTSCNEQCS